MFFLILRYFTQVHRLSGQLFSAFVSSSFQNVSSRGGSHSLSEAVNLASLSFLGLISPLHKNSPCILKVYYKRYYLLYKYF